MATLQEKLTEAQAVLHEWMIGRTVREFVDENGTRVTYSAININKLQGYVESLKAQIAAASGQKPVGPIKCWL